MKKSSIWVLVAFTLIFTAFVAGFYVGRNYNRPPVQVSSLPPRTTASSSPASAEPTVSTALQKVNINKATQAELEALPGVGPTLAGKIIAYRMTYGYFHSVSELLNVEGFGQKRLEALLEYITV